MKKREEYRLIIASSAYFDPQLITVASLTPLLSRYKERSASDRQLVLASGTHMGIEPLVAELAENAQIPYYRFSPTTKGSLKAADYACNERIAAFGHALFAFWDGADSAVRHLLDAARYHRLDIEIRHL